MDDKKSFLVYTEWGEAIEKLSREDRGDLFLALIIYADTGKKIELSLAADIAFSLFKNALDRDAEKWENTRKKRAEAGKKGGRPSKADDTPEKQTKANGLSEKQTKAKKAVNVNDNVNVNVNVNSNVIDSDNSKAPTRHKYGEYKHVSLSDDQYSSLVKDFGEVKVKDYIRRVDEYCEQHGKDYKNYALTVRNWIRRDNKQNGNNRNYAESKGNSFADMFAGDDI